MSRHEVSCINKSDRYNPYERITHIGGVNSGGTRWKLAQPQAITDIESGKYSFYVSAGGHIVDVIVSTHSGNKYLKTEADGDSPNNLLSLPECS